MGNLFIFTRTNKQKKQKSCEKESIQIKKSRNFVDHE